jgi:hypothetical protein
LLPHNEFDGASAALKREARFPMDASPTGCGTRVLVLVLTVLLRPGLPSFIMQQAAGGVIGMVIAMLLETTLLIIRTTVPYNLKSRHDQGRRRTRGESRARQGTATKIKDQ